MPKTPAIKRFVALNRWNRKYNKERTMLDDVEDTLRFHRIHGERLDPESMLHFLKMLNDNQPPEAANQ